jgi:RimJ/RimL family protein N-acetyltransferase
MESAPLTKGPTTSTCSSKRTTWSGGCRLNPTAGPGAAGIGYWVRSDRARRGYATAATRAATTATFEHLSHIERVYIHMDQANVASVAVPTKLGFELDHEEDRPIEASGHTGRGYVWVMTRDTWCASR